MADEDSIAETRRDWSRPPRQGWRGRSRRGKAHRSQPAEGDLSEALADERQLELFHGPEQARR